MKALVGAFNQEKALVGAFSVIVQLHRLIDLRHYLVAPRPVQQVVAAQRAVAVGAAHQQPRGRDGREDADVVLAVLGALPLEVAAAAVLLAARPVDPLQVEREIEIISG